MYLSPETYICEEGASGIGHPDDQDISKPIKDAGDGHTNIDDVVETDVSYRKPPYSSIEEGQAILSDHSHLLSQPNIVSIDIGWKMVRILQ